MKQLEKVKLQDELRPSELRVLAAIAHLSKGHHYPPSLRELSRLCHRGLKEVHEDIRILKLVGLCCYEKHKNRTLHITPRGMSFLHNYAWAIEDKVLELYEIRIFGTAPSPFPIPRLSR